MSSSRHYYAKKACPFCKEIGSLEVDTVEAEVFCTECAMVVARGLEEDEATRYLGGEGLSGVTRTEGVPAGDGDGDEDGRGDGGLMVSNDSEFQMVPQSAAQYLRELEEKSKLGERLANASCALFEEFMKSLHSRSISKPSIAGNGGELALASACFSIVSGRRFLPCPVHEIRSHAQRCSEVFKKVFQKDKTVVSGNPVTPPFTEMNILTKRAEIVNELGLASELGKLAQREHTDLANVYLLRLRWKLSDFSPIVSSVAKCLNEALEGPREHALSTPEAVCVGLFLCKTSKAMVRAMGCEPVPQAKLKELLEVIAWASHVPKDNIRAALKRLNSNPDAQNKVASVGVRAHLDNRAVAAAAASGHAAPAIGVKREREN